jgi:PHD finger-like domain-containing protein 5A
MCRKQPGIAIGRLCDKCDGKCPVCDSYVRPTTLVRICDECSFGNYQNKCVVCGGEGISDAFYCYECTRLEKDRDGCPKIINLGSSRTDVRFLLSPLVLPPTVSLSLSLSLRDIVALFSGRTSNCVCACVLDANVAMFCSYFTKRKRIGKRIINTAVARVWAGRRLWRSTQEPFHVIFEECVRLYIWNGVFGVRKTSNRGIIAACLNYGSGFANTSHVSTRVC